MTTKRLVALGSVLATVLALASCGASGSSSGGGGGTIKVGVIVPLSGTYAEAGQEVKRGYELALQEAGGKVAGKKVQLVFGDAFKPEDAISEAERLATREKVDIFLGSYATPASQAGSETAARKNLVWVETHAITDSLTKRGLNTYIRVGPTAADFAKTSVKFITDGLAPKLGGKPSVFVEHEDGPYGTSVAGTQMAALKAAGMTATEGKHKAAATDVTDSVLAAKRSNADIWLITGYAPDNALLLRTAAAQGYKPKATVLVGAGDTKSTFEAVGAKAITGTFVLAYTSPIVNPKWAPGNAKFYADYKAKFNADPLGTVANTGYTGMTSFLKLLDASGGKTDAAAMDKAAASVNVPEGGLPNGWGLKLDADRQNTRIRLLAVQWRSDGTVPAVWPAEAATSGQQLDLAGG